MAINSSNLKLSIRETITLNNNKYDSFTNHTISGINEISKRIVTVPTTAQEIIQVSGSIGPGAYITEDVKYVRISNLDDVNHVDLTFRNFHSDEFALKLDKGQTFIYPGLTTGGVSSSMVAKDAAAVDTELSMGSLTKVIAQASGSEVDMEIFIAST